MQILILGGKETETFQAGSGDAPLRALIEARMDTPELGPMLITEIRTTLGRTRLKSFYSEKEVEKMTDKILEERKTNY